jgi:hypothetical protein
MSFSYDLWMVVVAYRVALGGDRGGRIVVLLQKGLVGLESSVDAGLLTTSGCEALVLAWPCPIAWGERRRAVLVHAAHDIGGKWWWRGGVRSEGGKRK